MIVPQWTPAAQALWDRVMFLQRTGACYGVSFPVPGTSYRPPTPDSFLALVCFVATASEDTYEEVLSACRADMLSWKARLKAQGRPVLTFNLENLEFTL